MLSMVFFLNSKHVKSCASPHGGVMLSEQQKGVCVPWSAALEDSSLVAWGGRTQTWCILRVPKSAPRVCFRGNSSVDSRRVPVHALVLTQHD